MNPHTDKDLGARLIGIPAAINTDPATRDRQHILYLAEKHAQNLTSDIKYNSDWEGLMRLGRTVRLNTRIVIGPPDTADKKDPLSIKALELETKTLEQLFPVIKKAAEATLKGGCKGMEKDAMRSALLDIARMLHSDEKQEEVLSLYIRQQDYAEAPEQADEPATAQAGTHARPDYLNGSRPYRSRN